MDFTTVKNKSKKVKKLLTKKKSCGNINKLTGESKTKELTELVKNLDN
jgi:hypothetical protein